MSLPLSGSPPAAADHWPPSPGASGAPGAAGAAGAPGAREVTAAVLNPLALLAREFAGDISYDPGSAPAGAAEAWAFVRGKDLALRVIAVLPAAPGATGAPGAAGAAVAGAAGTAGEAPPPGGAAAGAGPGAEAPTPGAAMLHFPDPDLRRPTRFPFAAGAVAPPSGKITPPPHPGLEVLVPDPSPVIVLGIERLTAA